MAQAEKYYGRSIPRPREIHFKSNGSVGGWSNYGRGDMMFHLIFAAENDHEYFNVTIPHEVAHWVSDCVHGYDFTPKGKARHHGPRWKSVMIGCFNLPPERCHNMSLANVKTRVVRQWEYKCECRTWKLNTYKHNKDIKRRAMKDRYGNVHNKGRYSCPDCKTNLNFTGNEVVDNTSDADRLEQLKQQFANL